MRVIVNCPGGQQHSMMLLDSTTVQDVKAFVSDKTGTPAANQALLFAGRQLGPDSALLLDGLQLDSYSLADEVVVYMQPQLSQPVHVYLCGQPGTPNLRMFPEMVEASSTLANIQELLQVRQLTCTDFPADAHDASIPAAQQEQQPEQASCRNGGSCAGAGTSHGSPNGAGSYSSGSSSVVVKRQDGSCCSRVRVQPHCTIQELLEALWEVEGKAATALTFYQARDGCLHATYNC